MEEQRLNENNIQGIERLVLGTVELPALERIPIRNRLHGMNCYLRMCRHYRCGGWPQAHSYLIQLHADSIMAATLSGEQAVMQARREMLFFQTLRRLSLRRSRCLQRSLALTAGLIGLGLPAQLVLGKARGHYGGDYEFHAWTEVCGMTIDEPLGVRMRFAEVLRSPGWTGGETASCTL